MAPARRVTRQSIGNFNMADVDMEQQMQEMRRYEQERKDRQYARELYQFMLRNDVQQQGPRQREDSPDRPTIAIVRTPARPVSARQRPVAQPLPIPHPNVEPSSPPASPILAGAPRINRNIAIVVNHQPVERHDRPTTGPIRQPSRRIARLGGTSRPSLSSRRSSQVGTASSSRNGNSSSARTSNRQPRQNIVNDSDSDDSEEVEPFRTQPILHSTTVTSANNFSSPNSSNSSSNSSNSSSSNDSNNSNRSNVPSSSSFSSTSNGSSIISFSSNGTSITMSGFVAVRSIPFAHINQPLLGNDAATYRQEFQPVDNQPSTSGIVIAPTRKGTEDPTWGDCTMCFEVPIQPQGCNRCRQIIGCKACVDGWHRSAQNPSCPLCRRKWGRKPDVAYMQTIENRRRAETARRITRRSLRTQTVPAE